jgi:hypothetical protein
MPPAAHSFAQDTTPTPSRMAMAQDGQPPADMLALIAAHDAAEKSCETALGQQDALARQIYQATSLLDAMDDLPADVPAEMSDIPLHSSAS